MKSIDRALALLPDFAPVEISRRDAVEAARLFLGLPYDEKSTFVEFDGEGRALGHMNCHGLFFAWAQRLELVDAGIWRALQGAFSIAGVPAVLHAYMLRETRAVEEGAAPGDWLLFRWRQASPFCATEAGAIVRAKHHVALLSDLSPAPLGSIIHAVDNDANGSGGVFEHDLAGHDFGQIHYTRTLAQFID